MRRHHPPIARILTILLGITPSIIPLVSSFSHQRSISSSWTRNQPCMTQQRLYGSKQASHASLSTLASSSSPSKLSTSNVEELLKTLSLTSFLICTIAIQSVSLPVYADEYGRETEAPTIFTGENVMICTKRGPLGACLETTVRTSTNDNDKASKYFGDPTASLKEKYRVAQLQQLENENIEKDDKSEGSQLLKRLKQQSIDNKEINDKFVRQQTLQNDLSATFGPFDREVVVINSDGDSVTILSGPQATRLKQQGYLKGRRFVTQPTQETIDAAASKDEGNGLVDSILQAIFGGK